MKRSGCRSTSLAFSTDTASAGIERGGRVSPTISKSVPGADEFLIEYQRWLAGKREVGSDRTVSGSVSALVAKFYRSAEWATLSDATRDTYRGILERFRSDHGDKPVDKLERQRTSATSWLQGRTHRQRQIICSA